jgi:arylsulfatase A
MGPGRDQPNVVLIVADDLGYGDIGHFNGGTTDTPTLDRLLAEGVSLSQHYSSSPVCAPARASLLTGRYAQRTGAVDTLEVRGLDRISLRERTIADHVRRSGYRTGLIGKWHNGALDERYHPRRRGFDEFVGFRGGWQDYDEWTIEKDGDPLRADGRYLTDVFATEAADFIRRHRGEPFFLMVAFNAPHTPLQAPERWLERYRSVGGLTAAVTKLYGMVSALDRGVEEILDALARFGLESNTLVMFTSDNGPQFGGVGEGSTERFNCGFHGHKLLVFEGGIRVPMVLRWPGRLDAGTSSNGVVHMTDWLPTLARLVGADTDGGLPLDGVDRADLFGMPARSDDTLRFWQWNRYQPVLQSNAAVRDGDWKLVYPAIAETMTVAQADRDDDARYKTHPEEYRAIVTRTPELPVAGWSEHASPPLLFNLRDDPAERRDLAGEEAPRVSRMVASLESWFEDVDADRRGSQRETLRSRGGG